MAGVFIELGPFWPEARMRSLRTTESRERLVWLIHLLNGDLCIFRERNEDISGAEPHQKEDDYRTNGPVLRAQLALSIPGRKTPPHCNHRYLPV